jgi:hypothetical protein
MENLKKLKQEVNVIKKKKHCGRGVADETEGFEEHRH